MYGPIRDEGREIILSTQELRQYLADAEDKIRGQRALVQHAILPGVKKRKRSEKKARPERIASNDEAKHTEQVGTAAKCMVDDPDYENTSTRGSSSD